MKPIRLFLCVLAVLLATSAPVLSDAPAIADIPETWECPQADGILLYTDRERPGCHVKVLKPLSSVPPFVAGPFEPRVLGTAGPRYDVVPQGDWYGSNAVPGFGQNEVKNVPAWAQDWHADNTSSGSVQGEICSMYLEWIRLNEKTRGGFFFGADPSYGGDLSGRNLRSPSYSFYDNARWLTLSRIFGAGFVPIGCP